MSPVLKLNHSTDEGVRELLKSLLVSGRVKGVLCLSKMGRENAVIYSLITQPDVMDKTVPLFPVMPQNAGGILSHLTMCSPSPSPIAVVVKPCELRAFIELLKLKQGSEENFLLISSTCGGVYPLKMDASEVEEKLPQYWEAVKQGKIPPGVRSACMACENFIPYTSDMTISLVGNSAIAEQSHIWLNTSRGEQFASDMGEVSSQEQFAGDMEAFRHHRQEQKDKLVTELGQIDLEKVWGRCIGCHLCSKVCPVCYCHLCYFDSPVSEHEISDYETEVDRKKRVRVPLDIIFYHLVRLFHVATSCVGCGMCGEVCPVNIPLAVISLKVGGAVQEVCDYLPGRDVGEELPLTSFKVEEFAAVGE